ncbi:MAG: APC family permease [Gemmataceae bacterium]|nr:APC family permease [Gemmataceae bacterium]
MAENVLLDAGFVVALLSRRDFHHHWAVAQTPRLAFGDFWAFQCGWWAWSATVVSTAALAVLFTDYAQAWDPDLRLLAPIVNPLHRLIAGLPGIGALLFPDPRTLGDWLVCLLLIWSLTWLNLRGIRVVGDSSILMNVLLLGPFVLITLLGLARWSHNPFSPLTPPGEAPLPAAVSGLLLLIWLYSGYEMLSTVAEEVENPRRNFPRALAIAAPMVVLSYALPTLAALAALGGWDSWRAQQFTRVGGGLGGAWLAGWVTIGGLLSNASLVNVSILSVSRLPYAMALDRLLPAFLARASPRTGAPVASLLLGGVIYSLLSLRGFTALVGIYAFLQAANYIMIYLSLLRLRARFPNALRPFKIGGGRWGLALVVVPPMLLSALVLWKGQRGAVAQGLAAVAVGPLVYFLARLARRRTSAASPA